MTSDSCISESINAFGINGQVQPEEQQYVILHSSEYEELLDRIEKLEENLAILHSLISKNKKPGPITTGRASKINELMIRRQSISFPELRGILRCSKDALRQAIKLFLDENEGYGIIEGSDKRSLLLVKFRR